MRRLGPDEVVPGFDLAKYAPLETASVADWHVQVTGRRMVQSILLDSERHYRRFGRNVLRRIIDAAFLTDASTFDDERPQSLPPIEESRRTVGIEPLEVLHVHRIVDTIAFGSPLATGNRSSNRFLDMVKFAGMARIHPNLRDEDFYPDELRTYLENNENLDPRDPDTEAIYVDDVLREQTTNSFDRRERTRFAHIRVDLDALERTAVEEFRTWFKAERRARGLKRAGGTVRPAEWHRDRILPLIDLDLWARAHDATWSPNELAARLYPADDDKGSERTIEAARKTADTLMSDRMFKRLEAEAMREPA